jgi:hypothetical protein
MNVSAELDRSMRYLFAYGLFNEPVNSSIYAVSDDGADSGLEICSGT